jgi:hypothetical protein
VTLQALAQEGEKAMEEKIEIVEELTTEEEKGSRLKHVIPLNLSVAWSRDQAEHLPLAACDCDTWCERDNTECDVYG